MGYQTKKGKIIEQYCLNNPKVQDKTLARIIWNKEKEKGVFSNFDATYQLVRYYRGHGGEGNREKISKSKRTTAKPLNYNTINNGVYTATLSEQYTKARKKKRNKQAKVYFITWGQNNTPIHKKFFENMEAYAKYRSAEIHVILGRYKNPTSTFETSDEEYWDKEILKYADAARHVIHKNLELLSDVKIQPTAILPLSGMEGISGLRSSVIGHPRVHLKVVPNLEWYEPKILMTTGACTLKNYTDSKAGKKGEFHHTFGFAVIELKDNKTHPFIRQVTANSTDGSFTDLFFRVKDNNISKIQGIDAAILGDKHIGDHCLIVEGMQRKWLDLLKPKHTIIADAFNGHSINHHEMRNPIKQYENHKSGRDLLLKELDELMKWIDGFKKYNIIIQPSNHNDWLDRYIRDYDWKKDIKNSETYVELASIALKGKAPNGLVAYLIKKRFGKQVRCLGRNDMFSVNGFELNNHGDIGVNGSRGSINQYKRMATKMVNLHTHSPAREDGVLYGGTSTILRVGYNVGASNWYNSDVIIHKDKKAQHIIYMGAKKEFTTINFQKTKK